MAPRVSRIAGARPQGTDGLDVAYASLPSPLGNLLVASTRLGLVRVAYDGEEPDAVLEELAREVSPRIHESPAALEPVRRELDEYFDGGRRDFEVGIDLSLARGFAIRVLEATARIPFGSVSTYRDVAVRAGNPRAARAAGNALGDNPVPIVVPCHRVIRSGGSLGGYGGREDRKAFLLELEGAIRAPERGRARAR